MKSIRFFLLKQLNHIFSISGRTTPRTPAAQLLFLLFFLFSCSSAESQSITGTFPMHAGDEIRLNGFKGFKTYEISRSNVADNGTFTLPYSEENIGMGQLVSSDGQSFIVILSGKEIKLKGNSLKDSESIEILQGLENQLFEQYALEHPRREQAMSAWIFLENIYKSDSLFAIHEPPRQAIDREKQRIREEDQAFLDQLDPSGYVHWYLPVRKLVSSVPVIAQHRTQEIPGAIEAFRQIDYSSRQLYRSGLLKDVIESHFWLIENSGRPLDSVFVEMNISIDSMIGNLASDPPLLNEISENLFRLLERRSLFTSSEHLALSLLNNKNELLNSRLADDLEVYRTMKIGNTAPDIIFTKSTYDPGNTGAGSLSELDSDYTLIVFAASWCPSCRNMMPDLTKHYNNWKDHGVEVVLVSLDETSANFSQFTSKTPFLSTSDFQRWNSPIVKDWHITSIPAFYLLDNQRKILLRPNSVAHAESWIDWNLVKGNR